MRLGFVGVGNMSGAVVRALLDRAVVEQRDVALFNRTPGRLAPLIEAYPGINIAASPQEVAARCEVVFIGVNSGAVREVILQMSSSLSRRTHLITFSGGTSFANLAKMYPGPISKVIPSMTIGTGRGVTLVCHNKDVTDERKGHLVTLFSPCGLVREVGEDQVEAATSLTSCAPGLMAEMMHRFAESGARAGDLSPDEALEMVLETMVGTAIMLTDHGISPGELISMVATKGGITERGLAVLDRELPSVFDRVMAATLGKQAGVERESAPEFDQPA